MYKKGYNVGNETIAAQYTPSRKNEESQKEIESIRQNLTLGNFSFGNGFCFFLGSDYSIYNEVVHIIVL